jgi:hypothetical protein
MTGSVPAMTMDDSWDKKLKQSRKTQKKPQIPENEKQIDKTNEKKKGEYVVGIWRQ